MKNLALILSILVSSSSFVFAQDDECGTKPRKRDEKKTIKFVQDDGQRFIVPVIFHVLYNNSTENISDEKLLGVLETLQNDFLAINTDISNVPDPFKDKIGNPNVRFVLANTLPGSEGTSGIIRKYTSTRKFKFNKRKMFEESAIIESTKYLNIYICDVNTNGFTPLEDNPQTDGVVIGYWRTEKGLRTLTHEVGHWLNLSHIFAGGCDDEDEVADTPAQKKHKHICRIHPHIDCRNKAAMFMNFMDYSSCRYFFTKGQIERMRQYVLTYKPLLQREGIINLNPKSASRSSLIL